MKFTPKIKLGRVVSGSLTVAVLGLMGWGYHVFPPTAPIGARQRAFAVHESFPTSQSGVEVASAVAFQTTGGVYYQPISSWYKNKHWWKRNAPIVGGAGGGALVGGLVGGGTGALVGGAIGGGGGYLYKHSRDHRNNHHYSHRD
jgi:hypothetical protein